MCYICATSDTKRKCKNNGCFQTSFKHYNSHCSGNSFVVTMLLLYIHANRSQMHLRPLETTHIIFKIALL